MAPLFQDPRGHMFLLGGALWMATGIFVMRRMINFKL
jgi:tight adherence protein B